MAEAMRSLARTPLPGGAAAPRLPVAVFGLSLGIFFVVTFVLCVGYDLLFPSATMSQSWLRLLPGFTWLTWPSFLLGLAESFFYGWYVALIFCPLFNFFSARMR
jgi:hypothetical protein